MSKDDNSAKKEKSQKGVKKKMSFTEETNQLVQASAAFSSNSRVKEKN